MSRHSSRTSSLATHDKALEEALSPPQQVHTHPSDQSRSRALDFDVEKQPHPQDPPQAALHEERDPNLIDWEGPDDPENPQNWSKSKKWFLTAILGSMTFVITFASSIFSTATDATAKHFGVSPEVMILGTSLFVLGFCFGPPVWAPFSEVYGRKIPLMIGYYSFAIFQIPVAVATNVQTIMICRFFGGFFGCAPLVIVGGQMADYWDPVTRGVAICVFAGATMVGPVAGPIAGGFVTQTESLGWRWTEYLTAILAFFFGTLGLVFVPESFAPTILQRKAKRIRLATKNWAIHAKADEVGVDLKSLFNKYLVRPMVMLALEPILILMTVYISCIYGQIYLLFFAWPIEFNEIRGWNLGVGALPFLSLILGVILGSAIITYMTLTRFKRKMELEGRVNPEERLIPMTIGGIFFSAGMFWFAWTSNANISWGAQVPSGILIGAGILMIFMQGINYIIDVYLMHANSAIAGNTMVRSLFGAGFPLFAPAMYNTLGVDWATTVLAFIATACIPVPILFYKYGAKIRSLSKYSPTP